MPVGGAYPGRLAGLACGDKGPCREHAPKYICTAASLSKQRISQLLLFDHYRLARGSHGPRRARAGRTDAWKHADGQWQLLTAKRSQLLQATLPWVIQAGRVDSRPLPRPAMLDCASKQFQAVTRPASILGRRTDISQITTSAGVLLRPLCEQERALPFVRCFAYKWGRLRSDSLEECQNHTAMHQGRLSPIRHRTLLT